MAENKTPTMKKGNTQGHPAQTPLLELLEKHDYSVVSEHPIDLANGETMTDLESANKRLDKEDMATLFCYLDDRWSPKIDVKSEYQDTSKTNMCHVLLVSGSGWVVSGKNQMYKRILLIIGPPHVAKEFGHTHMHKPTTAFIPRGSFLDGLVPLNKIDDLLIWRNYPQPPWLEDPCELVSFLQTHIVFWLQDKVYATLYTLFPHVRQWIESNTEMHEVKSKAEGPMPGPVTDLFKCLTTLYVLGPGFRCKFTVEQRVYQRAEAAAQEAKVEMPPLSFFRDVLKVHRFSTPEGRLDSIFGHLLAINKDGEYDLNVTEDDLLVVKVNPGESETSAWAKALFNQARMLYHGVNKRTLLFVQLVLPYTQMLFQSMGQTWREEFTHAIQIVSEEVNRPYSMMVASIDKWKHYKKIPRLAYIARLWHRRHIPDDQNEAYLLGKISFWIESDIDKIVCQEVSEILPTSGLDYVTAIIKQMSPAKADVLLKEHSHLNREHVYLHMVVNNMHCEWLDCESRSQKKDVKGQAGPKLEADKALHARFSILAQEADRIQMVEKEVSILGISCQRRLKSMEALRSES